ncbi:hypothetical protein P280DRAFT_512188 [Massarina eburnea CBS 473.64]|uniref:Apple domain-containing protein n=1 Tax=Massarina eburnea CBS 473.64 TaxID=1395130 RepID=A0A6A6RFD0_9PLEO|nr:hypothetical protein P280DRAFT_512188 [Massarina eburnea CBS 473.64]
MTSSGTTSSISSSGTPSVIPQTITVTTTAYGTQYNCQCTPAPSAAPSLTCPSANATSFTGSCGSQWNIECGIDRDNHDLTVKSASTFNECMNICDATSSCVDVSYLGTNCYLKSGIGNANANSNVWGAYQVSPCAGSVASSIASPIITSAPKIKLHRKRVVRADGKKKDKRQFGFSLGWGIGTLLYVGPDYTFLPTTTTMTKYTSAPSVIVTQTVTPTPSGTATMTNFQAAITSFTINSGKTLTSTFTVTASTCAASKTS